MDIKFFISILLAIGVGAYFLPVENYKSSDLEKDNPQVIFEKPMMYTLTQNGITRTIDASQAVRYKNRDEMFDTKIVLRNEADNKKFNSEKLNADIIVKKDDLYTLIDNVVYARDDFISLATKQLYYDDKTKVVYNEKPFTGKYYNHKVSGENLRFDSDKKILESQNIHLEINMNKK